MNSKETRQMTEQEYVSCWEVNAKQHFNDGDYTWLCDFIKNNVGSNHGIVEIGCGAGYSTLSFAQSNFTNIVAIDIKQQAIDATVQLLEEYNIYLNIKTVQGDLIHQQEAIADLLKKNEFPVDIIVLCNPGGNLNPNITIREYNLLRQFGFMEGEINQKLFCGQGHQLHKWALIYSTCELAKQLDKMLVIVERGSKKELESILAQIQDETGVRKIASDYRKIGKEPDGGVPLSGTDSDRFWGAGLYYPV